MKTIQKLDSLDIVELEQLYDDAHERSINAESEGLQAFAARVVLVLQRVLKPEEYDRAD